MKKQIVFHPILIAIFPLVALVLQNTGKIPLRDALPFFILILIVVAFLWLILSRLIHQPNKSAVIVSVFFLLFFSYGHIADFLYEFLTFRLGLDARLLDMKFGLIILLFILSSLFITVCYLTLKAKIDMKNINLFLNTVSIVLTVIMLYKSVIYLHLVYNLKQEYASVGHIQPDIQSSQGNRLLAGLPSIYYIVLDGFARQDILEEYYQYSDAEFVSFLSQKGFYIASDSHSNYGMTLMSLSSSLNYKYINDIADQVGLESQSPLPMMDLIQKNRLMRFLHDQGYKIVSFSTGYASTEIRDVDVYKAPSLSLNAFQNELINITPLRLFFLESQYDIHRKRILYILDHLTDEIGMDTPVFVFAHILAPHPPFVFGSQGEMVPAPWKFIIDEGNHVLLWMTTEQYIAGYRAQLEFISKRIEQIVDQIVSHSSRPAIIILQSDHGPGVMMNLENLEATNMCERFSILNAYYFPDRDYRSLYPSITPVNTFRLVLDQYFGTDYGLLEDKSYFALWSRLYDFTDVTDTIASSACYYQK